VFRTLINDAKSAAGAVIGRYAIRASVAVPFIVAAGFATTAITVMLVDRFGAVAAYSLMAGGFALAGLLAAALVTFKEQEEERADAEAEKSDTADVLSDAASQAATQLPLAVLGTLMTSPFGPSAAASGARLLARNFPLVLLLVLIGFLLWPAPRTSEDESEHAEPAEREPSEETLPLQETGDRQMSNGMDRYAA
jgi:hypothetical protein